MIFNFPLLRMRNLISISNYRTFKWYYLKFVFITLKPYFSKLVSYNRFMEIMKMSIVPLTLYLIKYCVGVHRNEFY